MYARVARWEGGEPEAILGIALFETEADMRTGDAKLNEMSPPGDGMGTRRPVEFYEVGVDMRV